MISGQKIVAFTPCGRKRYMDLLAAHVVREQALGHIDKWILFNNPYTIEDSTYAAQLAAKYDWIEILNVGAVTATRGAGQIASFYSSLKETDCIYLRLDDDLIYIDRDAIPNLIRYRLAHPEPFLVYPTIINNTRTSYQLQQRGLIPRAWGEVEPILCAPTAWINPIFVLNLHQKALAAIDGGTLLAEFTLPSEEFTDWETGNISINSFAIFGKDLVECSLTSGDEEGYLSKHRPQAVGRYNARCGDAIVIHFAYHTQTAFMDQSGVLTDYARLVEPLPFRTYRLPPIPIPPDPEALTRAQIIRAGNTVPQFHLQRNALRAAMMARQGGGLKA